MSDYYGNLQDYLVNGDNYTQLQPDGSTLEIPGGQLPNIGPVVPTPSQATYQPLAGCCGPFVALIAHDATTDQYYVVEVGKALSKNDPTLAPTQPQCDGCDDASLCGLANEFACYAEDPGNAGTYNHADCVTPNQFLVDSTAGNTIASAFPQWFLTALGYSFSDTQEKVLAPDFWFVACLGAPFVYQPAPPPPPPSCVCIGAALQCCGVFNA